MRSGWRSLGAVLVASALLWGAAPATAATAAAGDYTCTEGTVPSGTYSTLTIAGMCGVDAGAEIHVTRSLMVLEGAIFDAQSAPTVITVDRNVISATGSMIGLGCQPGMPGNSGHPCATDPEGSSDISVGGNITVNGAIGVFLNGVAVGGNVTVTGGGSDIPWSIKNNTIDRNLTVNGIVEEWIGVMWNRIGGNVTLSDIRMTGLDDEAGSGINDVFVVRNQIGRNLTCSGLIPGVFGYGNMIARNATGDCAALAG